MTDTTHFLHDLVQISRAGTEFYEEAAKTVADKKLKRVFTDMAKAKLALADHLSALCAAASAHGTWVEINEKWACPGPRAIEAFAAAGVTLVASTDSHHRRDVGRYQRVVATRRGTAKRMKTGKSRNWRLLPSTPAKSEPTESPI